MAQPAGLHSERIANVRALLGAKGRREQRRFTFEGETLLGEALRSGVSIEEVYVRKSIYEESRVVREVEALGVPIFLVEDRAEAKISDLDSPSGIVAVAAMELRTPGEMFGEDGIVLVLAGINDPGNAGTLLRSADAFNCTGAVFGSDGADPYHPKVVRASMGALFRLPLATAEPRGLADAARTSGATLAGLSARGEAIAAFDWPRKCALVVGHERHGLGPWEAVCERRLAIPMPGPAESLNAAIAGSIALYEAAKRAFP